MPATSTGTRTGSPGPSFLVHASHQQHDSQCSRKRPRFRTTLHTMSHSRHPNHSRVLPSSFSAEKLLPFTVNSALLNHPPRSSAFPRTSRKRPTSPCTVHRRWLVRGAGLHPDPPGQPASRRSPRAVLRAGRPRQAGRTVGSRMRAARSHRASGRESPPPRRRWAGMMP